MKQEKIGQYKVKESIFPIKIFIYSYVTLLLLSGVHFGIILFFQRMRINDIFLVHFVLIYWAAVTGITVMMFKKQAKKYYDDPIKEIAKQTVKVANGDFSVYVPPLHTADKLNYVDVMIISFNKMVEELGSIETLKTDFFANVSHEIKTPIAVIQNAAELLKTNSLSMKEKQDTIQTIIYTAKKLNQLITNILKINKLEKQNIVPSIEKYDLCKQLCNCILNFETQWEAKNIEIDADIEDRCYIESDRDLLEIVWNNLLSNAIKFSETNGKIYISQKRIADKVEIVIEDEGCGMDEETLHHIFEKFYQGDTSHATEGNGLGLALTLRCLQMMNGCIRAESHKGKGSKFTVQLPIENQRKEAGI